MKRRCRRMHAIALISEAAAPQCAHARSDGMSTIPLAFSLTSWHAYDGLDETFEKLLVE